ncbi:MAG: penicillin-binding protein [Clostridia bacterium]|nr:penicillin-binding protein [Clostridia bacterium]
MAPNGKKKISASDLKKNLLKGKKEKITAPEYNKKGEAVMPKTKGQKVFGFLVRLAIGLTAFGLAMAIMGGVCFFHILNNYENIEIANTFKTLNMKATTYIYAYDEELGTYVELESLFVSEDRQWISFDDIPELFKQATIAIEDERFYEHEGVDWPRFILATANSFLNFRSRFGASTITMQLVKNVTGANETTAIRKAKEVFNATYIEKIYEKEDILELYLNYINYGGQIQGIMSASRFYFGKDPSQLSLIEVASIVGITNNPSMYNPYYADNREANLERAKLIVDQMYRLEMITEEQYNEAKATTELSFAFTTVNESADKSVQSYYVDTVIDVILKDLRKTYGVSSAVATRMLYQGGYKIYIPMDITVQNIMDGYYENRDNFPKNTATDAVTGEIEYLESAMIIMNYNNGDVLGVVGGIGEKELDRGFNRATSAFRQVGSVIKPIAVFAPGVELNAADGHSALNDLPNSKEGNWPVNFIDYYRGIMPLRRALAMSLNGPTVDLAEQIGPQASFDFLYNKCGVKNLVGTGAANDVSLSLSLGGVTNGLTVTEICAAYQIFPNNGVYNEPRFYTSVVDGLGNVVLDNPVRSTIALSEQSAFIMRDLLYELVYNGYSSQSRFSTSNGVKITCYGKTGTSAHDHDFWFCGFTSEFLGAVWMGFDSNARIDSGESGQAAAFWSRVMRSIYDAKGLGDGEFSKPTGVTEVEYCKYSGKIATDICKLDPRNTEKDPVIMKSWVKEENVPTEECDVHHALYICEDSGKLAHDNCPNGKVYAVAFLNDYRDYIRTDLYIEDAQYVFPLIAKSPTLPLYVSERLPAYMNIYINPIGWENYMGYPNDSYNPPKEGEGGTTPLVPPVDPDGKPLAPATIRNPGQVMSKFASSDIMNAVCQAHTPNEIAYLHPWNFSGGALITTPTHEPDPEPEPDPENPENPEDPENPDLNSSDVSSDVTESGNESSDIPSDTPVNSSESNDSEASSDESAASSEAASETEATSSQDGGQTVEASSNAESSEPDPNGNSTEV